MTTEATTWSVIRVDTIERFAGQTPLPDDETLIIDVFEAHPQLVLRAIDEIAQALADGKVTWAWGALRGRLQRGTTPLREATADTRGSTLKRIDNARAWIRNAGCHYDLERHVRAELFGDDYSSGILTDIQLTDAQKAELVAYWQEQRPRGVKAERDALEWAAKCGGGPARMREILAKRKAAKEAECQPNTSQDSTPTTPTSATSEAESPSASASTSASGDGASHSATPIPTAEPVAATTGSDIQW